MRKWGPGSWGPTPARNGLVLNHQVPRLGRRDAEESADSTRAAGVSTPRSLSHSGPAGQAGAIRLGLARAHDLGLRHQRGAFGRTGGRQLLKQHAIRALQLGLGFGELLLERLADRRMSERE